MEIKKLEEDILQIEELLYVLDGDLERLLVDVVYTENLYTTLLENIVILKRPGIIVVLESYKKTKLELKHLEARVVHNNKLEKEIYEKISSLERALLLKENKKNSIIEQLSSDKVLEFKRNLW